MNKAGKMYWGSAPRRRFCFVYIANAVEQPENMRIFSLHYPDENGGEMKSPPPPPPSQNPRASSQNGFLCPLFEPKGSCFRYFKAPHIYEAILQPGNCGGGVAAFSHNPLHADITPSTYIFSSTSDFVLNDGNAIATVLTYKSY